MKRTSPRDSAFSSDPSHVKFCSTRKEREGRGNYGGGEKMEMWEGGWNKGRRGRYEKRGRKGGEREGERKGGGKKEGVEGKKEEGGEEIQ